MSITQNTSKGNIFNKTNLPVTFTDKPISSNVTFTYLADFKKSIRFDALLADAVSSFETMKAANSVFSVCSIIDFMIDAVILGYTRFSHMEHLRNDICYAEIRGELTPSEKVCRDLLKLLPADASAKLRSLNKDLLNLQASRQPIREIMLDFDDTVVTVFGNQETANVGYNPKYHGRPSFKEKVGMISGSKELVNITLEEGSHHSNHAFLDFFKKCERSLPNRWLLKRIRCDRGFFDQDNFAYFEEQGYEYVVKAKMTQNIQKLVKYVTEHPNDYLWTPATEDEKVFHTTDITVPLPSWDKARRFVIIRKTLPTEVEGQLVFDECRYEYQAIVTNIDYLTTAEIFHDYNQRCTVETSIDELKSGFAFSENSQINYKCNELFMLIKMIAYNLHNWFKNQILPEELRHHEIKTLRRKLYRTAGMITGAGWYRHVTLQSNKWMKEVIPAIQQELYRFRLVMEAG
jgi:hypothetical protein